MKALLIAVALICVPGAWAGMYKCTQPNGSVTYQQTPCTGQADQEQFRTAAPEPDMQEVCRDKTTPESRRLCEKHQFMLQEDKRHLEEIRRKGSSIESQLARIQRERRELQAHRMEVKAKGKNDGSYGNRCPCYRDDNCRDESGGTYCIGIDDMKRYR